MEKYLTPEQARKYFNTTDNTLRAWEKEGKIQAVRPGGTSKSHRRYKIIIPEKEESCNKQKIIYARVSTQGQKEDLERQVAVLKKHYPDHRVIKDIGSGLNFKRSGFKTILDLAIRGNLTELVITNKDRLCRFGFELFQAILKPSNGNIVVLYPNNGTPEKELVDDVISIITVFSARMYGRRSHRNKRNSRQELEEHRQGTSQIQELETSVVPE